jgi:hypothetical protein
MNLSSRRSRGLAVTLSIAVFLSGCSSSGVREHRERDTQPSITVKPYWEASSGDKFLVGGLVCELKRAEGNGRVPVATKTSSAKEPVTFTDLEPGRYRVAVRGGSFEKVSEEVDLGKRRRATVTVDVEAAETKRELADAAEAFGEGALFVEEVVGQAVVVIAIVGFALAVDALLDDDDDDDD